MNDRLFGTDGIRGIYGASLTGEIAYRLGNSIGKRTNEGIVIGRDTRLTGGELLKYVKKGVLDAGAELIDLGIVPTPVVSYVTRDRHASFGIVITASHNTHEYNGIKVFSSSGMKIDDATECLIEEDMRGEIYVAQNRGIYEIDSESVDAYKSRLKEEFFGISGLNIGLDTGNGALSSLATNVFREIAPSAVIINNEADGAIINNNSGALHPNTLRDIVLSGGLDIGCAFDGDGDRICAVTHTGRIVNGDGMLYALAMYLAKRGELTNNVVIGTPYTNIGLEKALYSHGITLIRADVGDSNVALKMAEMHASLGGERAGHIILSRYGMTGDALLVALVLMRIVSEEGRSLDELVRYREYPTISGDFTADNPTKVVDMCADIRDNARSELGEYGRIIMRASGTEPKVRVMVECEDFEMGERVLKAVLDSIHERMRAQ